jgi:hypothetical protein
VDDGEAPALVVHVATTRVLGLIIAVTGALQVQLSVCHVPRAAAACWSCVCWTFS